MSRRLNRIRRQRVGKPAGEGDLLARYAPGRSVADIGGMWGIDGEHSFEAIRAGATRAVCVDLYHTPAFDKKVEASGGSVEFVFGDASLMETADAVGEVDLVWCFGLFYHHPSPFEILLVLRKMCRERLIIETLGIPEVRGVPNMALWIPMLDKKHRDLWTARRFGGATTRLGITTEFDRSRGYGNNFWAPSPSAMRSMLETAGFRVEDETPIRGTFRYVFVATPIDGVTFAKG